VRLRRLEKRQTHQSRERQTVPKSSHWRFKVATLEVLVEALLLHRGVHVRPDERDGAARDSSSFVADLDGDVLLTLDNDDLDRWEVVLLVDTVTLDDGTERVLEQLEANVGKMTRDVGESKVAGADELHRGSLEHGVMLLAHKARVLDRLLDNVVDVGLGADDANVVLVCLLGVECDVLADEEADSDTRHVEAV